MSVLAAAIAGRAERYQQQLSQGWHQHRAARRSMAPTCLSLFAGCGGSSLGYSMAGWQEVLAVDMQPIACQTFRLNFPRVPLHEGDITALSCQAAAALAGLPAQGVTAQARAGGSGSASGTLVVQENGTNLPGCAGLDLLDGSPPCQGFSTAGKRRFDDHRNQLFREYVRFLAYFKPKLFVMENVPGLVKGKMRLIFADILRGLKGEGYRVAVRQLNAMYYGVPQSRNRLIFIGVREDLGVEPSHPLPQQRPYTAGEALVDVKLSEGDRQAQGHAGMRWAMQRVKEGQQFSDVHPLGYWHNSHRIYRDRPVQTLISSNGYNKVFHWCEDRVLSPAEWKRLGSFPDEFMLAGTPGDVTHQIGNAVPPFFMKAIAEHCLTLLEKYSGTTEQADA